MAVLADIHILNSTCNPDSSYKGDEVMSVTKFMVLRIYQIKKKKNKKIKKKSST